jgi:deazaflavin-dependent oxidoreductase (nitroreductase family)
MAHDSQPYVRPGFLMLHVWNPVTRRLGLFPTLTVRGRKSGRPITVPLGEPLEFLGARYLVSGRGETHWVRNLRAAGAGTLRIHGRTEAFRAVEIFGQEREEAVAAYRDKLGHSVDAYFTEIPDPAAHAVFRLEPADSGRAEPLH